jgi:hypothetical protein
MCIASIPCQKDIMFMDEGYKLTIELEDLAPLPKEDDDMPQAPNDHDGENGGGNKDGKHSDDRDGRNKKILDEKEVSSSKSKTGVLLTSSMVRSVANGPTMKFGSFLSRWSDVVNLEDIAHVCGSSSPKRLSSLIEEVLPADAAAARCATTSIDAQVLSVGPGQSSPVVEGALHVGPGAVHASVVMFKEANNVQHALVGAGVGHDLVESHGIEVSTETCCKAPTAPMLPQSPVGASLGMPISPSHVSRLAGMNVVPPSMAEVIAFGGIPDMSLVENRPNIPEH